MRTCRSVSTLVATGEVQDAPLRGRLAVWLHLAMCPRCRRFWRQIQMLTRGAQAALAEFEREMPANLTERVVNTLSRV